MVTEEIRAAFIDIANSSYRFSKSFEKMMQQVDSVHQRKYSGQYHWLLKSISSGMDLFHLRLVDCEGRPYDPGMAVVPINIDEFSEGEPLVIEQMLEPIIMDDGGIVKQGTVLLGRVRE